MASQPPHFDEKGNELRERETPALAAFRAAAERLLAIELDDKELEFAEARGYSLSFGDKELVDPRMCDSAALNLSKLLPAKYKFEIYPTQKEMDALIARFKEIYRGSAGGRKAASRPSNSTTGTG